MSFDRIAGLVLETNDMPQSALDMAAPPDLTARDALPALVMSYEVAARTAIVLLQRSATIIPRRHEGRRVAVC